MNRKFSIIIAKLVGPASKAIEQGQLRLLFLLAFVLEGYQKQEQVE